MDPRLQELESMANLLSRKRLEVARKRLEYRHIQRAIVDGDAECGMLASRMDALKRALVRDGVLDHYWQEKATDAQEAAA